LSHRAEATMDDFGESYLGRLRAVVGNRLVLMPGARCLIERADGRVLLQQRADNHLWCMPSGYAEEGEDIHQVMLREVREETGLDVLDAKPWGYSSDPRYETMHYPNGDVVQAFGLDFHASRWSGELYADGVETLALDWFAPEALPPILEGHGRAIARFAEFKRTGVFQLY
jgi:8-oxo-dGTP pyrophosphatase MutT (NUDIX family)